MNLLRSTDVGNALALAYQGIVSVIGSNRYPNHLRTIETTVNPIYNCVLDLSLVCQ